MIIQGMEKMTLASQDAHINGGEMLREQENGQLVQTQLRVLCEMEAVLYSLSVKLSEDLTEEETETCNLETADKPRG